VSLVASRPTRAADGGGPHVGSTDALPVRFEQVSRAFPGHGGTRPVLESVDLDLAAGSVTALLGTSGCGKSTLLRQAAGLDRPTSGRVLVGGTAVRPHESRCSVGFQEPRLLPWRTVRDNIALGLPARTPRRAGRERVEELLHLVGLADHALQRPREISGGMAQRTSLARALARRPGVLLLDEPFGALDALTRLRMQDLLLQVHSSHPTTVLLVTHDVDEALQLADRVVVLGRREDRPAASVLQVLEVPGGRPRDRASAELARLRGVLLERLGVDPHHT
jgi:sulfonate transport system ATP-binding protein